MIETKKWALEEFRVGDVLLFTQRSKRGKELRTGEVVHLNYNGNGEVLYKDAYGYKDADGKKYMPTGQGSFNPAVIGSKPYGFYCSVEIIAHEPPRHRPSGPLPGDTGYDLMC